MAEEKKSHDLTPEYEKDGGEQTRRELAQDTDRRKSVALNIVENPLKRSSKEETVATAEAFAKDNGMEEHHALFGRAALVARDPERFQFVTELSEEEKTALQYEKDHKWHGPFTLWYAISLCAIGAATQGWDRKLGRDI
jgi:tRNA 2-selenouridine synthase SelU